MQDNGKMECSPGAPRLLVVDDDLVQRTIIGKIASQVGYDTRVAATLEEASRALAGERFDCVTLDLSLGEQSGTNLLRAVADAGKPPVIVISGCEERVLNSAVRLANMLGLPSCQLPKPLDLTFLRATLQANWPTQPASRGAVKAVTLTVEDVARALDRGEITPWFQPKVDLAAGLVVGCEALARWRHPDHGMIGAEVFIPLAEQGGLMGRLTEHMLGTAARGASGIVERFPKFSVAVNVSASLLGDGDLTAHIDAALANSGLPAAALSIEITESAVMRDLARATEILVGLRVRGVGVALDDFGTGYSSLAALARIPFSEMKIDRDFVGACRDDRDMARVVRACARLAHELDMSVVAEGIESSETLACLADLGADTGQGNLFAAAMEPALFPDWIDTWEGAREMSHLTVYKPSKGFRKRSA